MVLSQQLVEVGDRRAVLEVVPGDGLAEFDIEHDDHAQRSQGVPLGQAPELGFGGHFDGFLEVYGGQKAFDELVNGGHEMGS